MLATWDVGRREFRTQPATLSERILDCLMNPDALLLCWTRSGFEGSSTHVWESATGRELFAPLRFESGETSFSGAEFSHDRKRILAWVGASDTGESGEGFVPVDEQEYKQHFVNVFLYNTGRLFDFLFAANRLGSFPARAG